MTETKNLHLEKPEYGEPANIQMINENMDKLDTYLKEVEELLGMLKENKADLDSPALTGTPTANKVPIATTTPPQIKNIVLLGGVTTIRQSTYKKTQENVGIAVLSITKATNGLTQGMHVATLIDGYHPKKQAEGIIVGTDTAGNPITGNVLFNTDGQVVLWPSAPASSLSGICIYDI